MSPRRLRREQGIAGREREPDELPLDETLLARLDPYSGLRTDRPDLGELEPRRGDAEPRLEPVSPELVLVSPPELASLLRERLPKQELFEDWFERIRTREPERPPEPPPRPAGRALPTLLLAAGIVIAPIIALLGAVYPSLSLLAVALVLITALALRAPSYAVLLSLLLFGIEGSIKERLAADLPPLRVSPDALGAAAIDLGLGISLVGVLLHDRGRSLGAIWRSAGRVGRIALLLLVGWLAISVFQIPVGGSVARGVSGFRLTQFYVLAGIAGAALLARRGSDLIVRCLLGILFLVSAYAALRGVVGPSASERIQAMSRLTTPLVPGGREVVFRDIGSFASAIGLVSFLVPAGVFTFTLGLLSPRYRLVCWFISAFAIVGVLASEIRSSILAFGAGCVLAVALLMVQRGASLRLKVAFAVTILALAALGGVLLKVSASGSPALQQRTTDIADPLADQSLQGRIRTWKLSLRIVEAHPLGTGLGTVGRATATSTTFAVTADNSFVKILREQGIPGGALFVFGVLGTSLAAGRRFRRLGVHSRPLGVAALAGFVSFLVLAFFSEAIEQPGKVLLWLFLGLCLWEAFGRAPEKEHMTEPVADRREPGREPSSGRSHGRRPSWFRSLYFAALVTLVVFGAIVFTLIRTDLFHSSAQVSPTTPGNGAAALGNGLFQVNLVDNPDFDSDLATWSGPPAFTISHSTGPAHTGHGSLASTRAHARPLDGNAGFTYLVFPAAGRYRVDAWVNLPIGYNGGPPAVYLEGYAGSRLLAQQIGDPHLRGEWQQVWSEYKLVSRGVTGSLVLRVTGTLPSIGKTIYWDDVAAPVEVRNFVINPGFEAGLSPWADPPAFAVQQSLDRAVDGKASMSSVRDRRKPVDGNTGYTFLALPRAGRYRVEAFVYLPKDYDGGPPAVYLESYTGSRILHQRIGDPSRRGEWQRVWTDYQLAGRDRAGSLVLRVIDALPSLGKVIYWDNVLVTAPRGSKAAVTEVNVPRQSGILAALLANTQVRLGMFVGIGQDVYRPDLVHVTRSRHNGVFSFTLGVSGRTPNEASRMAETLVSGIGAESLPSAVQTTTTELGVAKSDLATRSLGSAKRARLEQMVENLTSALSAPAAGFVVGPRGVQASGAARPVDHFVDVLPGAFPPRPTPLWAGVAALLCSLGVLTVAYVLAGPRPRAPRAV